MNLFVYGTLLVPKIMKAVTGKVFTGEEAWLQNFACFTLKNQLYPGIAERLNAKTKGKIFFNLDLHSFKKLDEFEGEIYSRKAVRVCTAASVWYTADTYVVKSCCRELLSSETWDVGNFDQTGIDLFLKQIQAG